MPEKPLKLSRRGEVIPASPIRKLAPLADQAKKRGIKVYHVNIGQPDIITPKEFMDEVRNFKGEVLEYGHSKGDRQLLEAFSRYYKSYNINIEPEEIQVTTGGSEALIFAFLIVANPGDEVLVFEPFYTNYNAFAIIAGVKLVPVLTYAEDGFHLPDKKKIIAKISKKTRGILIASPNNPTGTVYTPKELETLAEIAKKYNLFIFSDEVYREFVYETRHTSIMDISGIEQRAILLDSISKRFSACGARVGCLASKNKAVVDSALRFGQARLCPPTLEQKGAIGALKLGKEYFCAMAQEYKQRRDTTYQALKEIPGVFCPSPEGAFYMIVDLPVKDVEHFAAWLLTEFSYNNSTTMIAPGPGFYATSGKGKNQARIAYVLKSEDMQNAILNLKEALKVYCHK